jgi:hypothetical protein
MKYFQCLIIGKNWANFARAPCLVWKKILGDKQLDLIIQGEKVW